MTSSVPWHFINTPEQLDEACKVLARRSVLGVDTEFMRETTFYPIPALIQLGDEEIVYLIDPTVLSPSEALRSLLGPKGPLKLLHACSEDLEVFIRWLGALPQPLVDTQLAHALQGGEPTLGYQRLVAHWCEVELPKGETRSDWLARPLNERQCHYAVQDVAWLPRVWSQLKSVLARQGRLEWLYADCARLVEAANTVRDDMQFYLRNRNAWRLGQRQLAALQRLCAWREVTARERNQPRNRLCSDALLFMVAEAMPRNRHELSLIEGIRPTMIKRDGDALLAAVRQARELEEPSLPEPLPSPISSDWKKRMKALKRVVQAHAEQLSLAPELLARRRELESWVMADMAGHAVAAPESDDWRGHLLNEELRAALAQLREGDRQ
ncbi:ribonuclease D [Kushneria phosphatilytica]|uniref:Ribonuclease D n=1 Tax=Kushneria phosphatilytica TaxID=657387 RepID=A0A1S1NWQ3_9GAMM|nr:ribonuclease D [Kushneria phosphatilytica]OHV10257.1 ribonuclease D [Kushneria phosphatilytica]QEL11557.1 ribonuclease D [Kushneria phosphatilytica]